MRAPRLLGTAVLALLSTTAAFASLTPFITTSGKITLSVDAAGTNAPSRTIRVQKPNAGATVRKAFMTAASTGFTGYIIGNGNITLDGAPVIWDPTKTMANSIQSWNVFADITNMVRAKLNTAPPGLVFFTVAENPTFSIDGEILAVIWDDPAAPNSTITLMYGAQSTTGDSFSVTLASPVDKTNPATVLDMSLGISYGYQIVGYGAQFSILEMSVNGQRISSSAGGQDDGTSENGGLITAGGIGDSNANPPPFATPDTLGFRTDDELYSLLPFVNNGDTSFTVHSVNPSNDDNIFFAAITLGNNTAIVGEGLLLSPPTGSDAVFSVQSAQAQVQTSLGTPVVGRSITFTVISGPNLGVNGTGVTNAAGIASFSYSSALAGSDTLQASMTNSQGAVQLSNQVTRTWQGLNLVSNSLLLSPTGETSPVNELYKLSARAINSLGQPLSGLQITFTATAGPCAGALGNATTDAFGVAVLSYTCGTPGTDTILASAPGPQSSNFVTHSWALVQSPTLFLSPPSGVNPVNGRHTLTVRAFNGAAASISGLPVKVHIMSGPNSGRELDGVTNSAGIATVFYTSSLAGTDTLFAEAVIGGVSVDSNSVTKIWAGLLCDVDNNTKIDNRDIALILAGRNALVLPGDVRDADFDGVITVLDARVCSAACTKLGCAQ